MLGEALRQLRSERSLSMAKLARLSDVSRTHLYAIENGEYERPSIETLMKLAKGLSAWRDEVSDPADYADVFRRLQVAAGYPVDASTEPRTVPTELEYRFNQIAAKWDLLNTEEKDHVAAILGLAGSFGHPNSGTLQHPARQSENGDITSYSKTGSAAERRPQHKDRLITRVLAIA